MFKREADCRTRPLLGRLQSVERQLRGAKDSRQPGLAVGASYTRVRFACPICSIRVSNSGVDDHRACHHTDTDEIQLKQLLEAALKSAGFRSNSATRLIEPSALLRCCTFDQTGFKAGAAFRPWRLARSQTKANLGSDAIADCSGPSNELRKAANALQLVDQCCIARFNFQQGLASLPNELFSLVDHLVFTQSAGTA
jgi:hypothetical protein